MNRRFYLPVVALLSTSACSVDSRAQPSRLGTIDFPVSASAAARPYFIRGVLFLHSFEYDSAANEFRKAQKADPQFAMAYWGEALTQTHPVWNEQDLPAARSILNRLAATPELRRSEARTSRERAYLDAVEILYGEGSKPRRDTLYSAAMERVAAAYPKDMEASAFYSLSLLGLNQGVRDVATYLRAAGVAEKIFKANPDHPGAAHYIIHAYDDPDHAPLGLQAARAYSKIAPGAAHAEHMTTHIFLAMGMWDEVASQNEIASGHNHDLWTGNHYTLWLNYAYIQQGRYAEARRMIEHMMPPNSAKLSPRQAFALAAMRARYIVDTEQWGEGSGSRMFDLVQLPPGAAPTWAFVKGFAAIRRHDIPKASAELDSLSALNAKAGNEVDPSDAISELELRALVRLAQGNSPAAIELMKTATAREDKLPVDFGPPSLMKPSHELYGEILLESGDAASARAEFTRALAFTPNRARVLLGLARAESKLRDSVAEAKALKQLRAAWHAADPEVLSMIRAGGTTNN